MAQGISDAAWAESHLGGDERRKRSAGDVAHDVGFVRKDALEYGE